MSTADSTTPLDFVRSIVAEDLKTNKYGGRVVTRFPPEPNGYLHIGHAKSICLNFGIAQEFGGTCNLRFDDTNPTKEDVEYVDSIKEDVRWVGFSWDDREYYASDYFQQLYDWAVQLIRDGKAYVCSLSADEMREYRGTLTEPGKNSPYRDRSVEENLDLFQRMKAGELSIWRIRTSTCAIPCSTAFCTRNTTAPATNGASTRCTTTRTASRTRSKRSRTRSARSNSRTTARCMTGVSMLCASITRSRSNSRGSTSPTP
jgi:hypothetical protein